MNLKRLLYVSVPLHDGSLSDVEKQVVMREFQKYSDDSNNAGELPETYEDYLLDQNPKLRDDLTSITDNDRSDMIIVHAAGGYGKSSLLEKVVRDRVRGESKTIELKEYCSNGEQRCSSKADLVLAEKTVNCLPYLNHEQLNLFIDRASGAEVDLLVLDGVDEIHLKAAKELLDALIDRRYCFGRTDIVLFARSELVDELISQDNREKYVSIPRVALEPHRITQKSLTLRVKNYLDYRAFKKFQDGHASDTTGDGIISGTNDQPTVNSVSSSLRKLLSSKRYLVDMLRLSFLSSLLIEAQLEQKSLGNSDVEIRQNLLREVMDRAKAAHGRPTDAASQYYRALATIARRAEPDEEGFFTMNQLMLSATDPGSEGQFDFEPYKPLRRSGLVSFIPADRYRRVRFEPIWLQAALVHGADWSVQVISYSRVLLAAGVFLVFALAVFCVQPHSRNGRNERNSSD